MKEDRRKFLKNAAIASVAGVGSAAILGTNSLASSTKKDEFSDGVVVGKAHKKEILYSKTQTWDLYYKHAD